MIRGLSAYFVIYLILPVLPFFALNSHGLEPEQVIRQELLANRIIINLYLLQLDFQDKYARKQIDESVVLFDKNLSIFSNISHNEEAQYLLQATKGQWPVISKHTQWVLKLPHDDLPPKLDSTIAALVKIERQLLIIRQILLTEKPMANHKLRFLEQALLMQTMTREYLSLSSANKALLMKRGQESLKTMSKQFTSKMSKITQGFLSHPHAEEPAKKASQAWSVISKSFYSFPDKRVPAMVALYSDKIISQLSSIHNMF